MKQVDIKIKKTARYFLSSEPNERIKNVWFVCHGYGQLAKYFIRWFEPIADEETLIVAPEGLHRFYWNGFSGNVVASWMTKEDRLTDIEDYVSYLDQTSASVLSKLPEDVTINVLGFSQGTATVCRWIDSGEIKPDNLIIWAGSFPDDVNYFENKQRFNRLNIQLVVGDNDEFYINEKLDKEVKRLEESELRFKLINYNGGHKVLKEPLINLANSLK